jgi:hypothetical protein
VALTQLTAFVAAAVQLSLVAEQVTVIPLPEIIIFPSTVTVHSSFISVSVFLNALNAGLILVNELLFFVVKLSALLNDIVQISTKRKSIFFMIFVFKI